MAGEDNGAWLGLLKWSLAYTDGTRPSSESLQPMSDEDRQFLESVMKDGIIDEGKRMKAILAELTLALEPMILKNNDNETRSSSEVKEEELLELLVELKDIVEQIDYAQAFMTMGGLPFLLGCASEREAKIPKSIRQYCVAIIATITQNNPPVQERLLVSENGLNVLGKLFYDEHKASIENNNEDAQGKMRTRILQAISCAIRGHVVGEESFCRNSEMRSIIDLGLGAVAIIPRGNRTDNFSDDELRNLNPPPPLGLRKKALFLLRALLTSDTSSRERIRSFSASLKKVIDTALSTDDIEDNDLMEVSLALLLSVLRQKKSVNIILDEKDHLVGKGVHRVTKLRRLPEGDEKELAKTELNLWESLIVEFSRCERDVESDEGTPALMISDSPANPSAEYLAQ